MDNMYVIVIKLGLALLTSLSVYVLLIKNLGKLLDDVVELPAGTAFYTRLLGVILVLIALSSALGIQQNIKENAAFMEYIWHFGDVLASIFGRISWFLIGYLLMVTILVAALRRRSE